MHLKFIENYLSIEQFKPIDLKNFTVLTGLNGSGKSHLLQAILKNAVEINNIKPENIILFDFESFKMEREPVFNSEKIYKDKHDAWGRFNRFLKNTIVSEKGKIGDTFNLINETCKNTDKTLWMLKKDDFSDESIINKLDIYRTNIIRQIRSNPNLAKYAKAFEILIKSLLFSADDLSEDQFMDLYKPFNLTNDFLPSHLGNIIWDYYNKLERNKYNKYQNKTYKKNVFELSDAEFEKLYGPKPWNIINEILELFSNLDYKINSPEGLDYYADFQLKLQHKKKENLKIGFESLSSGERVVMALVASVYKTSLDHYFPKLLLLDEVDALLHPSMIQSLLKVIREIFLKNGVNVILVTHSATTIALAPEESIFVMNKNGENRIVKKTQNEALNILTEGYATLQQGLKLFDEISKKKISIFTEGNNTKYIKKANEFFGNDEIEVIEGIESITGKNQLKLLFDLFTKVSHDKMIFFVWDPDVKLDLASGNNTFPFIFETNSNNSKVIKGIENLFSEKLFKDEYYTKRQKEDGGYHQSLNKKKFEDYIINNCNKRTFKNFKPLFNQINTKINEREK